MRRLLVVPECFLGTKDHWTFRTRIGEHVSEVLILNMNTEIVSSLHALVANVTEKQTINALGNKFVKVFLGANLTLKRIKHF